MSLRFTSIVAIAVLVLSGCASKEERQDRALNILNTTKDEVTKGVETTKQVTGSITESISGAAKTMQATASDLQDRADKIQQGAENISNAVDDLKEGTEDIKEALHVAEEDR